jgi:tetratricopeptide (TPR) repeat protein
MSMFHRGKRRPWVTVFFALQVFFIPGYVAEQACAAESKAVESARELASSAYYQIDRNRFDRAQLADAFAKLDQAAKINPNEPYLYLSGSLASLVQGFGMGDWYEQSSFENGTVERALPLAEKAVQLAPTLSQAHAQLARIYIMRKDFAKAQKSIARAKELEPQSFYPWYFEGIYYEKLRDVEAAITALNAAEQRATQQHQRNSVNRHRSRVAEVSRDPALQEDFLVKIIASNPNDGHVYAEYAGFLMCKGRYEDAIIQWEKTVHLMPSWTYAETQLAKARRMAGIEREKRTTC